MSELLKRWLITAARFDKPDDQGKLTPQQLAEQERKNIKVESVDNRNEEEEKDEDEKEEDEKEKENEDDDNNNNETEEEKAVRVAKEKEERRQGRIQKRIDKLTATIGSKDNEIAELKKQLAEKPVEGLSEEEVERRAAKKAEDLAAAKEADRIQKEFEKTADTLIKSSNKIDKDFEKNINEVSNETGVKMPKYMVEILADLDHKNGDEILVMLSKDEDLYEEIRNLSERRMTKRLEKMSEELKVKTGKNNQQQEQRQRERRLPDPIIPVNEGTNNRGNVLPSKPTQNMDEFVRIRNAQTAELRKQGKNIY